MNHDDIYALLAATGMPVAYDHFAEGESPDPPFLCFLYPSADHFAADDGVFYKITVCHVELYTDRKTPNLETALETVLNQQNIFYDKTETWIESEQLYEVLYRFEIGGM